jgi:hypothetical protein
MMTSKTARAEGQAEATSGILQGQHVCAYDHRCAISNLPDDHLLDAAHIMAGAHQLLGQPVVANGIALSITMQPSDRHRPRRPRPCLRAAAARAEPEIGSPPTTSVVDPGLTGLVRGTRYQVADDAFIDGLDLVASRDEPFGPSPFHLSALEPKHAVQHSFQRPAIVRRKLAPVSGPPYSLSLSMPGVSW